MTEPKRIAPSRVSSAARPHRDVLVEEVRFEDADSEASLDDPDLADVVWVPPEQTAIRGTFARHEGQLALFAVCDDCGKTTQRTAEHLFVPCGRCPMCGYKQIRDANGRATHR